MNWKDRIERAKKNGKFTRDDKDTGTMWNVCAVGEKLDLKDAKANDVCEYIDKFPRLRNLGTDFSEFVDEDRIQEAEETYNKILKYRVRK